MPICARVLRSPPLECLHYITADSPFKITYLTLTFVACTAEGEAIKDETDRTVTFTASIHSQLDDSILATATGNRKITTEDDDGNNEFLFPTLDKTLTVKYAEGVDYIDGDFYIVVTATAVKPSADKAAYYGLQTVTLKGNDVLLPEPETPSTPETPAVPEPTTATLSLLALAGLAARRRRK